MLTEKFRRAAKQAAPASTENNFAICELHLFAIVYGQEIKLGVAKGLRGQEAAQLARDNLGLTIGAGEKIPCTLARIHCKDREPLAPYGPITIRNFQTLSDCSVDLRLPPRKP